ncbi:MAG: hypothetical protein KDA93_19510 [Planctomycetaceae bacterium]|nr:hypothetical protein [Planctomycetaceae bacterium]
MAAALLHRAAAARPIAVPIPAVSRPAVPQLRLAATMAAARTPAVQLPFAATTAVVTAAMIRAAVPLPFAATAAVDTTVPPCAVVTSESASWPVFAASGATVGAASTPAVLRLRAAAARPTAVLRPVLLLVATVAPTESIRAGKNA